MTLIIQIQMQKMSTTLQILLKDTPPMLRLHWVFLELLAFALILLLFQLPSFKHTLVKAS